VVANIDVGLLAVFAILGFFPLIALLFSWASNSKYPFIGGLRALHQLIAFEIPFLISALSVVILSGTLNLTEVVESQIQSYWFIFFLPISAFVFYISSLAELERIPFDLRPFTARIIHQNICACSIVCNSIPWRLGRTSDLPQRDHARVC
jgi:NADH-quinone oxidoreductase subunit H